MILYQYYLANQGSNSCCWLYAPALAQCSIPGPKDFKIQVQYFLDVLGTKGHSKETIETWFAEGIPPHGTVLRDMGLTKVGDLEDFVTEDVTETYWKLYDVLAAEGPFVLQYPALGSGHIHQSAVVGLIYGEESSGDPVEAHLITPHTQNVRLTVLPLQHILKEAKRLTAVAEILKVPNRLVTPLRPDTGGVVWTSSGVSKFHQESIVPSRSFSLSSLLSFN
jgi:hypothetical protein